MDERDVQLPPLPLAAELALSKDGLAEFSRPYIDELRTAAVLADRAARASTEAKAALAGQEPVVEAGEQWHTVGEVVGCHTVGLATDVPAIRWSNGYPSLGMKVYAARAAPSAGNAHADVIAATYTLEEIEDAWGSGHLQIKYFDDLRVRLANAKRASSAYEAANPLGGPASMMDTIARRLRQGEAFDDVLADYGLRRDESAKGG